MHNDLILSAFAKAMASLENKGQLSPSKTGASELLTDYIDENLGFRFGERRLRDYYNSALKEEEIEIKQQAVRDGLACYLGYRSFEEWLLKTDRITSKSELVSKKEENYLFFILYFLQRNKTTFLITILGLVVLLIINAINQEKWMMWEGNNFVETEFDGHKIDRGEMFLLNEDRMERFKKIEPNCDTQFFNADGNAELWYGKNVAGDLEYFTELGKHPQTGKTLKPITKYMIKKYICK